MNSPGGYSQHDDSQYVQQVDPLTGQPVRSAGQPPQGYGASGYPQAKPKHGTAKLVVALVGIVVVLSAGGLGLHFWLTDTVEPSPEPVANPPQAAPPVSSSPPSPPSPTTPPPRTSTSWTEPSYLPNVDATIPGWQPIADSRTSVAYDVPGGWKVESPTVLVGFEDESGPRVAMHAVATYQDEACPGVSGSYRGHTGITGRPMEGIEPRLAAEVGARLWATAAAEVPRDDPSVPRPEAKEISLGGGPDAWKATVTITPPEGGDCAAPKVKVTTVSFTPRDGGGAVLFVMYTDQGVPDALPADVAKKIISTLRPVG